MSPRSLVEQLKGGLDAPICLTWELTYACNLACVHCLSSSGRRDPRELTTVEAKAVLGGRQFADLAVGAKDGAFTVSGPMNPGLLMAAGIPKNLLSPQVQVNLTTKLDQRRADTRLSLTSPAMAVVADGMLDLGRSQFQDLRPARLSRPSYAEYRRQPTCVLRWSERRLQDPFSPTTSGPFAEIQRKTIELSRPRPAKATPTGSA